MPFSEEEISRLYRIRQTLMEMLSDRGYLIGDDDKNMFRFEGHAGGRSRFKNKYGGNSKREDLVFSKAKKDNPSDQIYVFFPEEEGKANVGVKTVKTYINRMSNEDVTSVILVVQNNLSSDARTLISEVSSKFALEVFLDEELLVNIKDHALLPEHQVLIDNLRQEYYTVKETYMIPSKKSKRIQKLQELVLIKHKQALNQAIDPAIDQLFDSIDEVVDPFLLNDPFDKWLTPMGINREKAENELVFDGDDLTWGDVASGAGVGEPLANTRRRRVPRQTTGASTSRDKAILEEEEQILEVEEEGEVQEV